MATKDRDPILEIVKAVGSYADVEAIVRAECRRAAIAALESAREGIGDALHESVTAGARGAAMYQDAAAASLFGELAALYLERKVADLEASVPELKRDSAPIHRTRDACEQMTRYGGGVFSVELVEVLESITNVNDDLWHGRDPSDAIKRAKDQLDAIVKEVSSHG